jgi:hypothetical protein
MGELRQYLHGNSTEQHSQELTAIINRYGLSHSEPRLTVGWATLESLKQHILRSPILSLSCAQRRGMQPNSLHLTRNPYGMAVRIRNTDGSVLVGSDDCFLGMDPQAGGSPCARVYVVPADPAKPQLPLHYR